MRSVSGWSRQAAGEPEMLGTSRGNDESTNLFDPVTDLIVLLHRQIISTPLHGIQNLLPLFLTSLHPLHQFFHRVAIATTPHIHDVSPSSPATVISQIRIDLAALDASSFGEKVFLLCGWIGISKVIKEPEADDGMVSCRL